MRVIAIANQKGGCGKTTTSINFAACLAHLGKRVLIVDLDPQGHSTCGLGIHAEKLSWTIYDLLKGGGHGRQTSWPEVLREISPNLYVTPSYSILSALEEELVYQPDCFKRLKHELEGESFSELKFHYVILDCPPNLGVLTFNALEAADEIFIPIEPSFFSLHGLGKISETVQAVNQRRPIPLELHALLTIFDSRTRFAREVYDEVKTHFKSRLFRAIIHESVLLKEAASAGESIVQYAMDSPPFRDYFNLAVEYLEREWNRLLPEEELGWENLLLNRYGPRRVIGGILFQIISKNARTVEIAGDFNHWIPESLVKRSEDGLWQKVIPIQRGSYRYKFIVDGEWQMDPEYPVQKQNDFGTYDSYLELV
ncbi:MAG: AAA family ATPase [Candidatus Omnitrophica bacterium]|nr:AAA family ATPase [Candidatus Omnitrophota bacterium]